MENLANDKKIILFDGVCNLCNSAVQFLIKRDKKDAFRFVSLQSELGKSILENLKINTFDLDSIILYESDGTYFYKSDAVIEIARILEGWFYILIIFKILPLKIRNQLYDFVAKNRYKWFGKRENCMLPSEHLKSKFLQ